MRNPSVAILVAALSACAGGGEDTPPTLEITSPERGTTNDSDTVTVTGKVLDNGPVTLTINGTSVTPGADGTFTAPLTVGSGITFIETVALDSAGNQVRDVRAVLAGQLEATDGSQRAPIGARAGATALQRIGTGMGNTAEELDFTALAKAYNPVFYDPGCLGARVDITSVQLSGIDVILQPKAGFVDADIVINNLVVKADADYEVSCINGSSVITIRSTKAKLGGGLAVDVESGRIKTSLSGVAVNLEGFSFDASGMPASIENMVKNKVRSELEKALVGIINSKVPPIANTELAKLVAKPISADLLGRTMSVGVSPSDATISTDGLFVAVDTTITVSGGEGGMFVANGASLTADVLPVTQGFAIALADDAANQLFAGLWASGAFDMSLPIASAGPVAALLDPNTATLDVHLSLPPMVGTLDGLPQLSIGDLIVTGKDASGAELQKLALSIRTTLQAEPSQSNKLLLTLGAPEVKANIITQAASVARPLTDEQVEGIVTGVWGVVGGLAQDALGTLPMPAFAGLELGAPAITSTPGFILGDLGIR